MNKLAKLTASVTEFAARNTMVLVPAVPERDLGPKVNIAPGALDLPGFLERLSDKERARLSRAGGQAPGRPGVPGGEAGQSQAAVRQAHHSGRHRRS